MLVESVFLATGATVDVFVKWDSFVMPIVGWAGGLVRWIAGRLCGRVTAASTFFLTGQMRGVEMKPSDVFGPRGAGATRGLAGGELVDGVSARGVNRSSDHKNAALSFSSSARLFSRGSRIW